jgi:hypothetical protein
MSVKCSDDCRLEAKEKVPLGSAGFQRVLCAELHCRPVVPSAKAFPTMMNDDVEDTMVSFSIVFEASNDMALGLG